MQQTLHQALKKAMLEAADPPPLPPPPEPPLADSPPGSPAKVVTKDVPVYFGQFQMKG